MVDSFDNDSKVISTTGVSVAPAGISEDGLDIVTGSDVTIDSDVTIGTGLVSAETPAVVVSGAVELLETVAGVVTSGSTTTTTGVVTGLVSALMAGIVTGLTVGLVS